MVCDSLQNDKKSAKKTKKLSEKTKEKQQMQEMILALPLGTRISPKVVAMQNDRHSYYRWIDGMEGVEKIDGRRVRVG